jgi:hypothetical protein
VLNGLPLNDARMYAAVAGLVAVVALILALIALFSGSALRRRFRRWKSIHSSADLEAVYEQTLNEVRRLRAEMDRVLEENRLLKEAVANKISTARLVRFNAFDDVGSDLSFSLALLDDEQNGVVLSSIYGRDESRVYAKPVRAGESTYPLTEEERMAIAGENLTLQR